MFAKLPFAKKQHKNKNKAVSDVTDSRVGVWNNTFDRIHKQKFISNMFFFQKRLQKELQNLIESPPEGVKVGSETAEGSDMST